MKEVQHLLPPSPSPGSFEVVLSMAANVSYVLGVVTPTVFNSRDGDDGCLILMRKATKNSDVSPQEGPGFERGNGVVAVHGQQSVDHHHR